MCTSTGGLWKCSLVYTFTNNWVVYVYTESLFKRSHTNNSKLSPPPTPHPPSLSSFWSWWFKIDENEQTKEIMNPVIPNLARNLNSESTWKKNIIKVTLLKRREEEEGSCRWKTKWASRDDADDSNNEKCLLAVWFQCANNWTWSAQSSRKGPLLKTTKLETPEIDCHSLNLQWVSHVYTLIY